MTLYAVAWLAAQAFAADAPKRCVTKRADGGFDEPATSDELRACHGRERAALVDSLFGKKVGRKEAAALKALDRRQQREADEFDERHKKAVGSRQEPDNQPLYGDPDLDKLKRLMVDESDGGKKGVTPEMADQLRAYIRRSQGSVSPDMERLLQATAQDGATLRTSTVLTLRDAAKQAKGAGLDLGIDPGVEKALLETDLTGVPEHPEQGGKPGL